MARARLAAAAAAAAALLAAVAAAAAAEWVDCGAPYVGSAAGLRAYMGPLAPPMPPRKLGGMTGTPE